MVSLIEALLPGCCAVVSILGIGLAITWPKEPWSITLMKLKPKYDKTV